MVSTCVATGLGTPLTFGGVLDVVEPMFIPAIAPEPLLELLVDVVVVAPLLAVALEP